MDKLMLHTTRLSRFIITTLLSISILSCGGEGSLISAGISGTGIVLGVITGYGSIFVNGVEYDIDQANIHVDGNTADQNSLALGMVVLLTATDNGDGTGQAASVVYDDAIEGPVQDVPLLSTVNRNIKQFTILGQTVLINSASTTFATDNGTGFSFDTISKGDIVEVSGFADLNSHMIIATRVERKVGQSGGLISVELHGAIENLNLATKSFTVKGITVDTSLIDDSKLTDLDNGLQNGLFVEVNGIYQTASSITAIQIEGEDDDIQKLTNATGEVSLQGVVTTLNTQTDFELDGIKVDASAIDPSITMQIKQDIQIQVKGEYAAGVLIAQQLDIRSSESEFDAVIKSVDDISSKRIQIEYPGLNQTIELLFDHQSQLVDETQHHSEALTLDQLTVGMEVKAQVKRVGSDWVVVSLKHDDLNQYKIRGYITEKNVTDFTVTVNGLTVALDALADYEINDINSNRDQFFDYIDVNDSMKSFVDLEDGNTFDGLANFNEIELDPNH